eukprot:jgi/Chlat1/4134/Chrsp269S00292
MAAAAQVGPMIASIDAVRSDFRMPGAVGLRRQQRQETPQSRALSAPQTAGCRRSGRLCVRATQAPAKQSTGAGPPSSSSSSSSSPLDVVIVGAGVSGLCTAAALTTDHAMARVLVTEGRERVGGNITTVRDEEGGFTWEEGPNSFQPGVPMMKMAVDMGVKDELVFGDPDAPRFVYWEGKLRPVPGGIGDLPFFDLLSPIGKIRAGLGALGIRPKAPGFEETVEQFVRRNLGAEVFERCIEPFCSGVYAGDPTKLSMKAAFGKVHRLEDIGGSIVGGSFKLIQDRKKNPPPPADPRLPKPKGQTVGSFRKGLITLPNAIAARLGDKIKVNWKLKSLQKKGNLFYLSYDTPDGPTEVEARSVILTTPSYVAADILRDAAPSASKALEKFYYPPVGAVTISYPLSAVRPDRLKDGQLPGFGQLHPRSQGITTLGTIYSSSLFPNRCPDDRVLLLNYIGGAQNTGILQQASLSSHDDLVNQVDKDVRTMLIKPDAGKPHVCGVRVWPRAIPQFLVGHLDTLAEARAGVAAEGLEGLFLGGNYAGGVALGRCVEYAYECAAEVAAYATK